MEKPVFSIEEEECAKWLERLEAHRGDLTKDVPPPSPLLLYNGVPIWTEGNVSVISGMAKTKKSFALTLLVAAFLTDATIDEPWQGFSANTHLDGSFGCNVLWFDTEQGESHVYEMMRRIPKQHGNNDHTNEEGLMFFSLRGEQADDIRMMVEYAIKTYRPRLCIIDGIADLLSTVLDEATNKALAADLLAWTAKYNCHICTVIHQNHNSDKMTGHIGSALEKKAETVMTTAKKDDFTTAINFPQTRGKTPESIYFRITDDALPEVTAAPTPTKAESSPDPEKADLYLTIFEHNPQKKMGYTDVAEAIMHIKAEKGLNITLEAARQRVKRAVKDGYLVNTKGEYTLNIEAPEIEQEIPF